MDDKEKQATQDRRDAIRKAAAAMTPEELDHDDIEVAMANLNKRLGEEP